MNILKFRKPSRYINHEVNSIRKESASLRVALAFPDIYEIGMSHLGLKILYHIINGIDYASAERVFAPWPDMKAYLEESGNPLASLETGRPLREFDIVGFSLQYELSYPTVLGMLSLGDIPIRREERGPGDPFVIGGGPCTVNPAPLEPFFDAFLAGDGEEAVLEMANLWRQWRASSGSREDFLRALSGIEGFYVPGQRQKKVQMRVVSSLDNAPFPVSPPVPYTQIVHDRVNVEISRGCTRGCRFCQAGMVYRPLRERTPRRILRIVEESLQNTGYDEISFTSLSAGDYTALLPLLRTVNNRFSGRQITISLPSLRVGAVQKDVLREIRQVKKTGFTIAPEAATGRLRAVINKEFSPEDYEKALHALFSEGWLNLKLYFMIGLPSETEDDIEAIPGMVLQALNIAKKYTRKHVNITLSISPFVPKPHTPFQWSGQESQEELERKVEYLKERLPRKGINLKVHDRKMSLLEAALSRGGSETGDLLLELYRQGAYLDGWTEHFDLQKWEAAFEKTGLSPEGLVSKTFEREEPLPWDVVDIGVKKEFLWREYEKAMRGEWTGDCSTTACHACGLGCKSGEFLSREEVGLQRTFHQETRRFSPVKVRVRFSKTFPLDCLSHLELTTALLRGLRRAGVPLVYSEGYSPSPRVSFGPPLSVGIGGLQEYLDMEIYPPFDPDEFIQRINHYLPEGLRVEDMAFVFGRVPSLTSFITLYEYEVRFPEDADVDLGFMLKGGGEFRENMHKFDIMGGKRVKLQLLDRPEKKVKVREMLEGLFGMPMEELEIIRTGLFGFRKRWITPMELVRTSRGVPSPAGSS